VPLGTQLIWKLRTLISTGVLAAGARLPGLREVAESAGVNVNTVRAVFAKLEEQRLLASEQGRGTFVARTARPNAALLDAAQTAIAQAHEAGVEPRELAAALYVGQVVSPAPERSQRLALYAEIEQLEQELVRLEPLSPLDREGDRAAPRILSLEELRRTRDQLAARLHALRDERQQWREEEAAANADAAPARSSPWQGAGVWTGRARARVSFTSA
jgi:DNA-binding transcriptional regulator YhcF (GntR family)